MCSESTAFGCQPRSQTEKVDPSRKMTVLDHYGLHGERESLSGLVSMEEMCERKAGIR